MELFLFYIGGIRENFKAGLLRNIIDFAEWMQHRVNLRCYPVLFSACGQTREGYVLKLSKVEERLLDRRQLFEFSRLVIQDQSMGYKKSELRDRINEIKEAVWANKTYN